MKIIGIMGWAGSGKDTVADVILEILDERGLRARRRSLANPVKDIAYEMGWDGKKDDAGRKLLQDVGMCGRAYSKDVWLDMAKRYVRYYDHNTHFAVIPDVRFENEADWCMQEGTLIRVIRDGVEQLDHPSETELDNYLVPVTVHNNGSKEDLKTELTVELERVGMI